MLINLHVVLVVTALVCMLLAAINIPSGRVQLGWLGLFIWCLAASVR
jgi:hypothetical protein